MHNRTLDKHTDESKSSCPRGIWGGEHNTSTHLGTLSGIISSVYWYDYIQ